MDHRSVKRLAFYLESPFHDAMMVPIFNEVKDQFDCLLTSSLEEIIEHDPAAVFVASKCKKVLRSSLPKSFIIWTRHGFSSKNWAAPSIKCCDIACVSSEWQKQEFMKRGHSPKLGFWVTGFPPMDSVFRNMLEDGIPEKGKTILYAPTFDKNLSAFPVLGTGWIKQVLLDIPESEILIKLHPHTVHYNPRWIEEINDISMVTPQIQVLDPQSNIFNIMHRADILVADLSSVALAFLVLDRPIVLVSNPNRFKDKKYDPEGPESRWRDLGVEVSEPSELLSALRKCLEDPSSMRKERQLYRERLFGDRFDGLSSKRIAAKIQELLSDSLEQSLEIKRMKRRKAFNAAFDQARLKLKGFIRGKV